MWVLTLLKTCFEDTPGVPDTTLPEASILGKDFDLRLVKAVLGGVSRVILTQVGDGPEKVEGRSLINEKGGPKNLA